VRRSSSCVARRWFWRRGLCVYATPLTLSQQTIGCLTTVGRSSGPSHEGRVLAATPSGSVGELDRPLRVHGRQRQRRRARLVLRQHPEPQPEEPFLAQPAHRHLGGADKHARALSDLAALPVFPLDRF
jgi:hypothetical protein